MSEWRGPSPRLPDLFKSCRHAVVTPPPDTVMVEADIGTWEIINPDLAPPTASSPYPVSDTEIDDFIVVKSDSANTSSTLPAVVDSPPTHRCGWTLIPRIASPTPLNTDAPPRAPPDTAKHDRMVTSDAVETQPTETFLPVSRTAVASTGVVTKSAALCTFVGVARCPSCMRVFAPRCPEIRWMCVHGHLKSCNPGLRNKLVVYTPNCSTKYACPVSECEEGFRTRSEAYEHVCTTDSCSHQRYVHFLVHSIN
jgi:hypothetical protein